MSLAITGALLQQMRLDVSEKEKQEIDDALQKQFGFMEFSHCEDSARAYELDPEGVKEFVMKLLNKKEIKPKKKEEIICQVKNKK